MLIQNSTPTVMDTRLSLFEWTPSELKQWLKDRGQPSYRSSQILQWVYLRGAKTFAEMTDLSKPLREEFSELLSLETPPIETAQRDPADDAVKILLRLSDQEGVEAVCMRSYSSPVRTDPRTGGVQLEAEEKSDSYTLCVSTQAGCMFACRFCASGQLGLKRNLTVGEIISQIIAFLREGKTVSRVVFMGTGEPLHNLEVLRRVIEILCSKEGLGFSPRRLTVSTVGLVPEIYRIAQEGWKIKPAISLHAATDEKRAELVPIAKVYPLESLMDALRFYQRRNGRRISFEYLMIDAFNDSRKDADRLQKLCDGLVCHFNLIPYNPVPKAPFQPSPPDKIEAFKSHLRRLGIDTTVRYSRGRNIDAACGQLRLRYARSG